MCDTKRRNLDFGSKYGREHPYKCVSIGQYWEIGLISHSRKKLTHSREDKHDLCAKMTHKIVKRSKLLTLFKLKLINLNCDIFIAIYCVCNCSKSVTRQMIILMICSICVAYFVILSIMKLTYILHMCT